MFSRTAMAAVAILGFIALCAPSTALGEPIELARTTVEMKGPGPHETTNIVPGIHTTAAFKFEANTSFGGEDAPSAVWSVGPLTPANVGQTFTLEASDSNFQGIAARLTDGEIGTYGLGEDVLFFTLGVPDVAGGGEGTWEHYVFHDNSLFGNEPDKFSLNTQLFVPMPSTIDLHGAVLSRIVMRIDSVGIFHVENSTALRGGYTLSFFGIPPEIVPEPSAYVGLLILIALAPNIRHRQNAPQPRTAQSSFPAPPGTRPFRL